jgi:hypothetical protein
MVLRGEVTVSGSPQTRMVVARPGCTRPAVDGIVSGHGSLADEPRPDAWMVLRTRRSSMKKYVAAAVVLLALSATTWGFGFNTGYGSMWLSTQQSAFGSQSPLWPQQNPCGGCGGCGTLSHLASSWLSDCDCCCGCGNPCGGGCGCGCYNPCGSGCGCYNPCGSNCGCGCGCSNPCGCGCGCGCDDQIDPFDMLLILWHM